MSYWILENPVPPGSNRANFLPYSDFVNSWISGSEFDSAPPKPIELIWNPENESGIRKSFYSGSPTLMLKDMATTLHEAGVDNLATYPVAIKSQTNDDVCLDYVAVNILGALAVANMEESVIIDEGSGMIDVIFGSLVIWSSPKNRYIFLKRLGFSFYTSQG